MARLLDSVLGHQEIIERFLDSNEAGRLPHTFLFVGPSGVGRKTTAIALAQALLCEKSPRACGVCASCIRVNASQGAGAESLLVIEPEKNQIRIDQARSILDFLSLRTLSKNRVVVIDGADSLNPQAANALLKALEEPPEGTYFFMVAPSPTHILPTLRSRAQIVSFQPLEIEEMKKNAKAPEWALRASQGSFERLHQLLEKDELEMRESALLWLQDWISDEQAYLKPGNRDMVRSREEARSLAHHISWLLRDAMYLKLGAPDKVLNSDKISFLQKLTQDLSEGQLMKACERSLWIEQKLDQNLDSSLVFEQFWIETRPQQ
jgi:DNA polymerase-3 subunit delta'